VLGLSLPATADCPALARSAVRSLFDVRHETLQSLVLLVSEVVTSAVRRMQLDGVQGDIELRVDRTPTELNVRVSDLARTAFDTTGDTVGDGRWHLLLLDQLTQAWGVQHRGGRTSVWFRIDTGGEADARGHAATVSRVSPQAHAIG
jgi:hypothetical protein